MTLERSFSISLILSLIYAVTDEIHQTFVPTREGRFRDVIIDLIGILIMYTFIKKTLDKLKNWVL